MDSPSLPVELRAPWYLPELEKVEGGLGSSQLVAIPSESCLLPPRCYKHLTDAQHSCAEG